MRRHPVLLSRSPFPSQAGLYNVTVSVVNVDYLVSLMYLLENFVI